MSERWRRQCEGLQRLMGEMCCWILCYTLGKTLLSSGCSEPSEQRSAETPLISPRCERSAAAKGQSAATLSDCREKAKLPLEVIL